MSNSMFNSIGKVIKSMGLVFGDIGTSPIYTLTVIFITTQVTLSNIIGVLSLIIWTMILLVTVEYAWLAMNLNKRGEGGEIVLREILLPLLKSSRKVGFYTILTFMGVSLLVGDGVITPAISILSAVEGLHLIPALSHMPHYTVLIIAAVIAIGLFAMQSHGAEKVSGAFGPFMVIWFLALSISGLFSLVHMPVVINAINPLYGLKFITSHGIAGFFVLSEVILCATGAEALYADMGHLGRKPIVQAWGVVFIALVLNYLGQGAFLAMHPNAHNVLFEMIISQSKIVYIPFLILSLIATVIASQALISGMFSIVYQGITTRILPMFKVDYTSEHMRSQIYIGTINWFLLVFVLIIMFHFGESSKLASAYGFAVTGSMTITATMMTTIYFLQKRYFYAGMALFIGLIDICFLIANFSKIPTGGYWSIIVSSIPFALILLYTNGQRALYQSMTPMEKGYFLQKYKQTYNNPSVSKIHGTALYFARGIDKVPPYVVQTMFMNNIIYEDNVFIYINQIDEPYGLSYKFSEEAEGLRLFQINVGYMEVFSVEEIFRNAGINEKVIFYGIEDVETTNVFWKMFSVIKKLTPSFVRFYKLPAHKLHGIITRVEM